MRNQREALERVMQSNQNASSKRRAVVDTTGRSLQTMLADLEARENKLKEVSKHLLESIGADPSRIAGSSSLHMFVTRAMPTS